MSYYLLQNSLEAVYAQDPYVKISSRVEQAPPHSVRIEIFNTGVSPKPEDIEQLFPLFYSTKATGTGFGLPIARLAVRKNYGKLVMQPVLGQGTVLIMTLRGAE